MSSHNEVIDKGALRVDCHAHPGGAQAQVRTKHVDVVALELFCGYGARSRRACLHS